MYNQGQAKRAREQINKLRAEAERNDQRKAYRAEYAEARACGHEFPSFRDWLGETTARERAEWRMVTAERFDDTEVQS